MDVPCPEVKKSLDSHEWDFPDSKSERGGIHSIHPYPAKFIPDIPKALIEEFPPAKGTCVFDPFCGSGTTMVEAQRMGYDAIGVDLNPIACRISRVKTSPTPERLAEWAERCVAVAINCEVPIPDDIPNLGHWFKDNVSHAVAGIKSAISLCAPFECRDALELTLSSILVRVSNQDSDTRYAAVEKSVSAEHVYSLFKESASRMQVALETRGIQKASVEIIESDILALQPQRIKRPVGLVVTSPPYPNAYEYWLYHKYRMWWLGHDAHEVRAREIGARAHFFGGREKAGDFLPQMSGVFALLAKICAPSATICFVVGDSKIHGEIVDNGEILRHAAAENNFVLAGHTTRNMRANKKSFNLAHARIRQEQLIVFKKSGVSYDGK